MGRHLPTAKAQTHKETSLLRFSSTPQRDKKDNKMRAVMIALLPLAAVRALSPMELLVEEWETWKAEHGKPYGHESVWRSAAPRVHCYYERIPVPLQVQLHRHRRSPAWRQVPASCSHHFSSREC